jgi:hypothetical protein
VDLYLHVTHLVRTQFELLVPLAHRLVKNLVQTQSQIVSACRPREADGTGHSRSRRIERYKIIVQLLL